MFQKSFKSSNVHSVAYDKASRTLTVRFHSGSEYSYAGVHPNTYHGMMRAPSKGKYFHKRVRGRFEFEKKGARREVKEIAKGLLSPENIERLRKTYTRERFVRALGSGGSNQADLVVHPQHGLAVRKRPVFGTSLDALAKADDTKILRDLKRHQDLRGAARGFSRVLGIDDVHGLTYHSYVSGRSAQDDLAATQAYNQLHPAFDKAKRRAKEVWRAYDVAEKAGDSARTGVLRQKAEKLEDLARSAGDALRPHVYKMEDAVVKPTSQQDRVVKALRRRHPRVFDHKATRNVIHGPSGPTIVDISSGGHNNAPRVFGVSPFDGMRERAKKPAQEAFQHMPKGRAWLAPRNIALAGLGVTAIGGAAYLAHRHLKRRKEQGGLKTAALTTTLEPHQERVRERMKRQDGLVVAHDMGSGKTLASIAVLHDHHKANPGATSLVLPPAALLANYRKEIQKHTGGTVHPTHLVSQQKQTILGAPEGHHGLLIVDEAHRARNVGSKLKETLRGTQADKRMLMTGTPVYNHPSDIAPLVNLAAGHNVLPETPAEFERKFISQTKTWPKGLKGLIYRAKGGTPGVSHTLDRHPHLMNALEKYVDFHKPVQSPKHFPSVTHHEHRVSLSEGQKERYDYMLGKLPAGLRAKVQMDLPPNKTEAMKLVAFLGGPRQISNSVHGFHEGMTPLAAAHDSPKIQAIMDRIKAHPKEKHLVYSNYIDSAVTPISAALHHAGIAHGKYTGVEKKRDRDQAVTGFNEGKHKVLVVSSAGGEGLDLKGVRHVHITEPHWNEQKLNQVMARANRFGSHTALPKAQRTVQMHRYLTQIPKDGFGNKVRSALGQKVEMHDTAESYIQHRATEKETLNEQMNAFMAERTGKVITDMHKEIKAGPKRKVMKDLKAELHAGPPA